MRRDGLIAACTAARRAASLETIVARIPQYRREFGITRIAETTYLDRIAIPTMSAFVPASRDTLGVYSGKGTSREEALVGAVMEAVERQVAVRYDPEPTFIGIGDLERSFDFAELGARVENRDPLACVAGRDLQSSQELHLPLGLVNPSRDREHFPHWTTNGLAAGSTVDEAVYHALFEVVERHCWSEVAIAAQVWPQYFRATYAHLIGAEGATALATDDAVALEIEQPTGNGAVDDLLERIAAAGVSTRLFVHTRDGWPIAASATVFERNQRPPMIHGGTGASWSPEHAVVRALLEAVSSRSIDIQGAREDLVRAGEDAPPQYRHGRRLEEYPVGRWFYDVPARTIAFSSLRDTSTPHIVADTHRLLNALEQAGLGPAIVVDLSPSSGSVCVVRVVAPKLERFVLDRTMSARMTKRLTRPFEF